MPATTIKVPSELRDRLNSEARESGNTVATVIERLLADRDRVERFRRIRQARAGWKVNGEDAEWMASGLRSLSESDEN